jgi:hypothetical protein
VNEAEFFAGLIGITVLVCGVVAWIGLRAQRQLSDAAPGNTFLARLTPTGVALSTCLVLVFVVGAAARKLAPESELGIFLNSVHGVPAAMGVAVFVYWIFASILARVGHPIVERKGKRDA